MLTFAVNFLLKRGLEMSSTLQANTTESIANHGWNAFWKGFLFGGVITLVSGAAVPVCILTGFGSASICGGSAVCIRLSEEAEEKVRQVEKTGTKVTNFIAKKSNVLVNTVVAGGFAFFGAALSSLDYYFIGKDCKIIDQSDYCHPSLKFFYLTSSISAIAAIATVGFGIRFLTLKFRL